MEGQSSPPFSIQLNETPDVHGFQREDVINQLGPLARLQVPAVHHRWRGTQAMRIRIADPFLDVVGLSSVLPRLHSEDGKFQILWLIPHGNRI